MILPPFSRDWNGVPVPLTVRQLTAPIGSRASSLIPSREMGGNQSTAGRARRVRQRSSASTDCESDCDSCDSESDSSGDEPRLPGGGSSSLQGFEDILYGPFAQYLNLSKQIGGDVATHAGLVGVAFQAQRAFLEMASKSKKPTSPSVMSKLLEPTSKAIQTVQDFREQHRGSPFFNHLSALSESVPALGWVTIEPTPGPYVKEMNDSGQFYTNRVLKDWKEKDKKHVDWAKAWVQVLTDLQAFIKQYHTTGLEWNPRGTEAGSGGGGGGGMPPPPPPMIDLSAHVAARQESAGDDSRSALFAQLNQGEGVTKGLKKVTSDMQTHKNPTLRTTGPPPPVGRKPVGQSAGSSQAPSKPPRFALEGKKWMIEFQHGNRDLVVNKTELNQVVYMYRCTESTVQIKGKINSVVMDSCKKCAILFDDLLGQFEFVNCQSCQMQVLGKVPTVSVDKSDGVQMFLSASSMDANIISAKSSEMNVVVPQVNGDCVEYPIPEQFRTVITKKGLMTTPTESTG